MSATPSVFDKPLDGDINDVAEGLAILVDGDTAPRAISSGQYLFIKNHTTLATGGYHAASAIASGATISSSNVTADADGIANSLNSSVTALNSNITNIVVVENKTLTSNNNQYFVTDLKAGYILLKAYIDSGLSFNPLYNSGSGWLWQGTTYPAGTTMTFRLVWIKGTP